MAWTQTDADAVRAAIVKLASGQQAVTVSYAGPPARSVTYAVAQLEELRALLSEMERSAKGAPSYRLATTSKGL